MLIDDTCEEHGCEERAEDTDNPCGGKALDGAGTEGQQDDTCDERGEVRVEDGAERVAITCLDGFLHHLSGAQLFLDALIDKHVGIYRSTQRQHHTGYTTHGEGCLERGKDTEGKEYVDYQGQVSYRTRDDIVHQYHVDDKQHKGYDERYNTLLDRLGTQRRTYYFFLYDTGRGWHTSRLQRVGQVFGHLNGKVTRYSRLAAVYL